MFNFSQRSKDKMKGVHPDLIKVMEEAIRISPIDFAIVQGVRTQEEQNALYEQGRTKPAESQAKPMIQNPWPDEKGRCKTVGLDLGPA